MRGLILAFQFLTRLPVPKIAEVKREELARTAVWFPVVGLAIGVLLAVAVAIGATASVWMGALAGILAWVLITGALHLDGLADVTDALAAAHASPERFHEVLKDPHVGSFGVIAIVLLLLAKLVLIAEVTTSSHLTALVLVPAWARWGPLVWSVWVPPLSEGMGATFRDSQDWRPAGAYAAALTLVSLWVAWPLLIALAVVPSIALYWRRRLGGMTGDCHGASVEVTEALLLAALAFW